MMPTVFLSSNKGSNITMTEYIRILSTTIRKQNVILEHSLLKRIVIRDLTKFPLAFRLENTKSDNHLARNNGSRYCRSPGLRRLRSVGSIYTDHKASNSIESKSVLNGQDEKFITRKPESSPSLFRYTRQRITALIQKIKFDSIPTLNRSMLRIIQHFSISRIFQNFAEKIKWNPLQNAARGMHLHDNSSERIRPTAQHVIPFICFTIGPPVENSISPNQHISHGCLAITTTKRMLTNSIQW